MIGLLIVSSEETLTKALLELGAENGIPNDQGDLPESRRQRDQQEHCVAMWGHYGGGVGVICNTRRALLGQVECMPPRLTPM